MEAMGDLLEKVREFASYNYTTEEATRLFGWHALDVRCRCADNDETHITITFENDLVVCVDYFLNLDPTETDDICELTLGSENRSALSHQIQCFLLRLHPRPGILEAADRGVG